MREIKVGLIGFGTVGAGVVKILQKNSKLIENRMGAKVILKRIADVDLKTDRGVRLKPGVLTRKAEEVIMDPEINIVIELIGGIEPAKTFILQAIRNRKHIVTANMTLLALHGDEAVRDKLARLRHGAGEPFLDNARLEAPVEEVLDRN